MKPLAAIGIDPGTSVGYAAMTLEAELIAIGSERSISFDSLLRQLTSVCRPVIVATDKASAPGLVKKFATRTGARLWHPDADLLVKEKKSLAESYGYANDHEMDSVASARMALHAYADLLKRISRFVKDKGKQSIAEELTKLVIVHQMSIATACELLEEPETEEMAIVKRSIDKGRYGKEYESLLARIRVIKEKLGHADEKIAQLTFALKENQAVLDALRHRRPIASEIISKKESSIRSLSSKLGSLEAELSRIRRLSSAKDDFISCIPGRVLMVRLRNLGEKETKRLKATDMHVLVDDPTVLSGRSSLKLAGKRIFTMGRVPGYSGVCRIDAKPYKLIEGFALFEKDDIEHACSRNDVLVRIIDEYRTKRGD